jgi:hypothetical protein
MKEEGFELKHKKTRTLTKNNRKIITGISISSGEKLTIPKREKRELRKNIYFVLTNGLSNHKNRIHSTDPVYLKRLIGKLSYWHLVEPENEYVLKSLAALKQLEEK